MRDADPGGFTGNGPAYQETIKRSALVHESDKAKDGEDRPVADDIVRTKPELQPVGPAASRGEAQPVSFLPRLRVTGCPAARNRARRVHPNKLAPRPSAVVSGMGPTADEPTHSTGEVG
jgi:hypothetical protein